MQILHGLKRTKHARQLAKDLTPMSKSISLLESISALVVLCYLAWLIHNFRQERQEKKGDENTMERRSGHDRRAGQ